MKNYIAKISGPLLDRIDIHVEVPAVECHELKSGDEEHKDDAGWFSNIHHKANADRIIAQAEFDCITQGNLLF